MWSLYIFVLLSVMVAAQERPIARVTQGVLQGTWRVSAKGRTFASFQGIPYARPPVGKYRFREPQPLKPWPGVWDASRTLSPCLQYEPFEATIMGSENCLFLNVYTPKLNAGASLPVIVYIHGGAFMYGTGALYQPDYLMDRDMVVVTLNYRLGPLGFLSTSDEASPGNYGLKDQSFALRWVKENIAMFGGNPDAVTLTGCSAGGASVHYHYLSPLSKGTFSRGIAFSGAAFASWTHAMKPAAKARTLAGIVGCPAADSQEMVQCLRYRPAEVIVNAQIEMFDWKVHMFTPFTPTTEPLRAREPFLTQYPFLAAEAGMAHKLPLIATVTSEEGLYPAAAYQKDPSLLKDLELRWEELASNIFEYNDTLPVELRSSVAAKIKQHYLGGKAVGQDTFPELVQALSDRLFVSLVGKLAESHALHSGQPTYLYRYSFRGQKSLSNLMAGNDQNYGVSHADDVFHIFKFPSIESESAADMKMTDILLDIVYSYASTGVPRVPGGPAWPPVTPGAKELTYLDLKAPGQADLASSADFGQRRFWDSLGFVENEKYRPLARDEL